MDGEIKVESTAIWKVTAGIISVLGMIVWWYTTATISELKGRISILESTRYDMALDINSIKGDLGRIAIDTSQTGKKIEGLSAVVQGLVAVLERQQNRASQK